MYLSTGFEPADSKKGLTELTRSPFPSPWIVGRADDRAIEEENARTLTGAAAGILKLDEVAFLAETARRSVLDASERADMIA